jgi:hypothetical protein
LTIRFWQPLSLQHLLPFIGTFEDVPVEVGVGVSSLYENPTLLSHVWVSIALLFLHPLILRLPHLLCRLCVCACIRLDTFSLSLSLSLLPLADSVSLSIFSARLSSNVSATTTQRQVRR